MTKIQRRTGERHVIVKNAAGTISAGDAVQYDEAGEIIAAVTAKEVLGIALEDATSSTTVTVDVLRPGDECVFPIESGTMGAAEIGNEADLASPDGLTLTESNGDVVITDWDGVTTTQCYGTFKNLAHGSPGANLQTT